MIGHKFSAWKTTSFNLKNKTSTQTRKCSVCGKTETQTNKNAAKITVFGSTGAVPDSLVKLIAKASI